MKMFEFLGWNVMIVGVIVLIVILYLVSLINKRRKSKFLHGRFGEDE